MINIGIISDGAGWILDNIAKDFLKHTRHRVLFIKPFLNNSENLPDIVWCLNPWSFSNGYKCPVVLSMHHINVDKIEMYNFDLFNKATLCIVPNDKTLVESSKHLKIPLHKFPYWILSERITEKKVKETKEDVLWIGSFQKDTQRDGTPKLVKGPDILVDVIKKVSAHKNIRVLLAGWDRRYIISEFKKNNIPYECHEKANNINDLYDRVDWYLITSRHEGGPQSVLDCAYRKVNVLSTDVGIAPEVLHKDCICRSVDDFVDKIRLNINRIEENYSNSLKYLPSVVVPKLDDFFERICQK